MKVDKGRILISIVLTNDSFLEEVKLNNRHTDRAEFSGRSYFPILFSKHDRSCLRSQENGKIRSTTELYPVCMSVIQIY